MRQSSFPRLEIHTDQAFHGEGQDLLGLAPGDQRGDGSRVGSAVVQGLPEHLAGELVKAHHASPVGIPHQRDEAISVHPGGGRETVALRPFRQSLLRRHLRVKLLGEVHAPFQLAVGHCQTAQLTQARLHVNTVAIHQRSGTWPRFGLPVFEAIIQWCPPDFAACVFVDRVSDLLALLGIEVKDLAPRYHRRSMPIADFERPDTLRIERQRFGHHTSGSSMAIACRAEPAGPVTREAMGGSQHDGNGKTARD